MKKKRLLSLVILMFTLISFIPFDGYIAIAAGDKLIISSIEITKHIKEFGNKDKAYYSILIYGNLNSLDGMSVAVRKESGEGGLILASQNPEIKNEFIAPASDDYENKIYIAKNGVALDSIDVLLPDITSIDPSDGIVITDGPSAKNIKLNITGIPQKENGKEIIKGSLYQGSSRIDMDISPETTVENKNLKDKTGSWGVEFKRDQYEKEFEQNNFEGKTKINISARYDNVFSLRKKLNVSDEIGMFPTQGPKETEVTLQADTIHENISIFLLKNKTDRFTKDNMVDNSSIRASKEITGNKKEVLFTIPKSIKEIGSYYVVLTNRVEPDDSIDSKITQFKIIDKPRFTIIDAENSLKIVSIEPEKGPTTGIKATLRGRNIAKVSKDLYSSNSNPEIKEDVNKLEVKYKDGKYNGKEVKTLKRNIKAIIGGPVTFEKGTTIGEVYDDFNIIIPENTNLDSPIKDVVVEVETEIEYKDGDKVRYSERDILKNGFTYYEVDFQPVIENIEPNKIPVDDNYKVTEDIVISISGKNFLKHRYIYKDPSMPGSSEIKVKLPEIDIQNQNKSSEWFEDIEVYNENGNIIDGEQEFLGNTIVATIKKGSEIPKGIIGDMIDLRVTNPLKIDGESEMGSNAIGKIKFVKVSEDKTPSISSIDPYIVPTEGEEDIVITGDKFLPNVKVYINGVEIKDIKRGDTGKKIVFDAPERKEGEYQILVQNEEGGAATYNGFTYVKAYTNIKINDFNPKKGTMDTLVTIKGENFLQPNPLVKDLSGNGIDKLIGTKVLLDGVDINSYNRNPSSKAIELRDYTANENNFIVGLKEDGTIQLSKYYNSIILKEKDGSYFNIINDLNSGKIVLKDGNKNEYTLKSKNKKLIAVNKNGGESEVKVNKDGIELDNKKLSMQTVYSINEENIIDGNRVRIIGDNELEFKVPLKKIRKYYDITVVNPDTRKDSKVGENGFYYYPQPNVRPKIDEIVPDEGSVDGGYNVKIKGSGFERNTAGEKSIVIIHGEKVDGKDVVLSKEGDSITFKVPKFKGTIDKDVGERRVTVGVVNPDGGSASVEDGFTYVIPQSKPEITSVIDNSGEVTTDDVLVSIEGNDFRFYEPFISKDGSEIPKPGEYRDLNGDGEWTDLRGKKMDDLSEADKIILPKVYFGNNLAEIVDFSSGLLIVKLPRGQVGTVKVYIVNNDSGKSNEKEYKYEGSELKIDRILPSVGRKQGNEYVEIHGTNLLADKVTIYESSEKKVDRDDFISVQFGENSDDNISNKQHTKFNDSKTGIFKNNETKEIEVGNLKVKYRKGELTLKVIELEDNKEVHYEETFKYNLEEAYFPINLLRNKEGERYSGNELIKISEEKLPGGENTMRLRIDRGFAFDTKVISRKSIGFKTPSFYRVGNTKVTVTNPDKISSTIDFNYSNPDSNPIITNVYRNNDESMNIVEKDRIIVPVGIKSNSRIYIEGSGFRKGLSIEFAGKKISDSQINYHNQDQSNEYSKLSFNIENLSDDMSGKEEYIIITNPDTAVTNSIPYYLRFTTPETTDMSVIGIVPNFGPSSGGTEAIIHGTGFRESMTIDGKKKKNKVYFDKGGKLEEAEIIKVEHDKIYIKTPAFNPGKVDVIVENPDGNSIKLIDGFTYMSSPTITNVVDPKNDKRKIETIPLTGGDKIKIKGTDFMNGAKVVFNPKLREVKDNEVVTGNVITIGNKKYLLESGYTVDGEGVEFIDGQNIIVTTPEGKIGDKGVIVINPDNGATNIYNLIFGIPEIGAPLDVHAEVVYDEFIRVTWDGVTAAKEYEIYMSEDGKAFEYIGSTDITSFVVNKLKPKTKYQFLVRAMGKYGTSKPIDESKSNTVITGSTIGPKDTDGPIGNKTEIKKDGTNLDVVLGREDFGSKGLVIDLTRGDLIGVKDITIRMPANVVSSKKGNVLIKAKDYSMNFNPSVFNNSSMNKNKDNKNAGVVFKISSYNKNPNLAMGQNIVGGVYSLEATSYVNDINTKVDRITGNIMFNLDKDNMKINSRKLNNVKLSRYNNGSWVSENAVNRMGLYTLIGSRR